MGNPEYHEGSGWVIPTETSQGAKKKCFLCGNRGNVKTRGKHFYAKLCSYPWLPVKNSKLGTSSTGLRMHNQLRWSKYLINFVCNIPGYFETDKVDETRHTPLEGPQTRSHFENVAWRRAAFWMQWSVWELRLEYAHIFRHLKPTSLKNVARSVS